MRTLGLCLLAALLPAADWTDYRGPNRDGKSPEKGLPDNWAVNGQNFLWRAPFPGRSTPIVMNGRVYVVNPVGAESSLQERAMALDAYTGKVLWEYKFNVYHSDVPAHRIAWASPAGDPETGNVYVFGGGGTLVALTRDGKKIWERTLVEDFGIVTTHGGRTVSPIVEGNMVIVSGITTSWGDHARAGHRFMAFDKRTGECLYVSVPGGRPFDTTYSPMMVTDNNGTKLLVAGGGDGTIHAIKVNTGEPVWKYSMSKRGVNTGVVVHAGKVIVSHSEENLDTSEMGLLAAVDINSKGDVKRNQLKWELVGPQMGFSSPVVDGDRLYQIDNGANVFAYDINTGKQLWKKNLGTLQKGSPVLADGKLYVGTENGAFFILKPGATDCDVLSTVKFGTGAEDLEQIIASPAVSNGIVYFVTQKAMYAFGKKNVTPAPKPATKAATPGAPAYAMVTPTDLALKPGQSQQLRVWLFDAQANPVREAKDAKFELAGLKGTVDASGKFTAAADSKGEAGLIKATADGVTGQARARVLPLIPVAETFESYQPTAPPRHWINTTGKYEVRAGENGNKILAKLADNPFTKRARSFFGQNTEHDYTIEADVMASEKRRQMGDAGVVAQRYQLVLFGNHQRLELQPWQPETTRTVAAKFEWKKDTWYRLKLRVENLPEGKTRAQGKVWVAADPEPTGWLVERVDPIGNRQGAPGVYADAPFEVYFDNIKVTSNQ
jgi:outer membrane protein assembly factor BamB